MNQGGPESELQSLKVHLEVTLEGRGAASLAAAMQHASEMSGCETSEKLKDIAWPE